MKMSFRAAGLFAVVVMMGMIAATAVCQADDFSRKGKVELYGMVQNFEEDNTELEGTPIVITIKGTTVGGFGVGGNIDDHFNLNTDLMFGKTKENWTALGITEEVKDHTLVFWNVNLDYNILKSRVTPMVTGGIGVVSFSGWEQDKHDFSYNVAGGLRVDATDRIFFKALYKSTWTKMKETTNRLMLGGFEGVFGFKF